MIRTGIRPRIRPALDLPGDSHPFRRVLPFRRSWLAIGVVAAFDLVFLIPAIITFGQAAQEWGGFDSLFDLVAAIFLSAWLMGWSIAPLLLTLLLALLLFGREVVSASRGSVRLFTGLPLIGVAARYDPARMRNLRLLQAPPKSGKSWRGSHLAFDYGANQVDFGSSLDSAQVAELKSRIEAAAGAVIRDGAARPEDLEGQWDPQDALLAEPLAEDSTAAAVPVALASPSALALIAANAVPVVGTVFLGWSLADVMVLYWAESAVIGFFNLCKIAVIGRWLAWFAGPFFAGHFGGFMAVHFLFIYSLFVEGPRSLSAGNLAEVGQLFLDLWPALAALFLSHAYSFFANFIGRREYLGRTVQTQMTEPYTRIVFMHLTLIFGGFLTLLLGEPAPVLLAVIGLKVFFDLRAHTRQHGASVTLKAGRRETVTR
jgi:hypothetical protein